MIDGVIITPLKRIADERGAVMHMLRRDSEMFKEFGEIYFSTVQPSIVKAWRLHKGMTLNYAVPVGQIGSPTQGVVQEIEIGENAYKLITVPPLIWNGFMGLGTTASLIANCATIPHDPNEIERLDMDDAAIPYTWPETTS